MVPSRTANILPVNGSTLHPNLAASLSNAFRVNLPRDHLVRVSAIVAMRSVRVVAEPGSRRARRRASVQGSPPRRDDTTNARTTPHPHPEDPDAEAGFASASGSLSLPSRDSLGVCSSSGHRFAAAGDPQGNVAVTKTASSAVSLRCMSTAARKSATAASRSAASRSRAWSRNRIATNVATNAHTASATNHHKLSAFSRWWGWSSRTWAHPVGCGGDRTGEDGTSGAAVGRGAGDGAQPRAASKKTMGRLCSREAAGLGVRSTIWRRYFFLADNRGEGGARTCPGSSGSAEHGHGPVAAAAACATHRAHRAVRDSSSSPACASALSTGAAMAKYGWLLNRAGASSDYPGRATRRRGRSRGSDGFETRDDARETSRRALPTRRATRSARSGRLARLGVAQDAAMPKFGRGRMVLIFDSVGGGLSAPFSMELRKNIP